MTKSPSFTRLAGLAALLALTAVPAHAATTARPQIKVLDAAAINAGCDVTLVKLRAMKTAMEKKASPSGIFDEWNRLSIAAQDWAGPLSLLANVHTDKATRDAADACEIKFTPFESELFQSEALYKRVQAAKPATAHQTQYRQDLLDSFEDAGVTLPPEQRAQAKALVEQIAKLEQQFAKNIRDDDTKVVLRPEQLAGMPDSYTKAQKRDDQGNYVLTLANPSYIPFMTIASDEAARKTYWLARQNLGGAANIQLLDQAAQLRLQLAKLYGYPDFATYKLKRRMAGDPKTVYKFLDDVRNATRDLEKSDIEELRAFKADETKVPLASTVLNRWDLSYYQERLKKARYNVDQEALRKYFPTEASIAYTLKVAETLYGVKFVARKVDTWHPDVRYFDVFDATADGKPGKFLGGIYLDLFPRDGKYNHAAAWPVRGVSTLAHRTPISALVTNFDRNGLNQDELETMLHEFGHVLHGVLSQTEYVDEAGTAVKRDFVEAPSQMFEEWARREEPLKLFAQICSDCPQLTTEQINQLDAARKFGRGMRYGRQWLYAAYDMSLTTPNPDGALQTWERLEGSTPMGTVPGTLFPSSFGHLMGGYTAGYYGYMWSEVLALDMLSGYQGHLMNPEVGHRYRKEILSQGGQLPPEKLVENFLGRKPNSDAFFKEITGQR